MSDITAASWVKAANSVITWSHTEGAGRRSCKINTWRQCGRANPQSLDLVSVSQPLFGSVKMTEDERRVKNKGKQKT